MKERQFRSSVAVTSINFLWLVLSLPRESHSREIRAMKTPWQECSAVSCSYSSAPVYAQVYTYIKYNIYIYTHTHIYSHFKMMVRKEWKRGKVVIWEKTSFHHLRPRHYSINSRQSYKEDLISSPQNIGHVNVTKNYYKNGFNGNSKGVTIKWINIFRAHVMTRLHEQLFLRLLANDVLSLRDAFLDGCYTGLCL